eukprot:m.125931 g.125931  ORF g.125931 m.125931 type:complete len:169 (+) comp13813_c1_seq7:697-1203(+)
MIVTLLLLQHACVTHNQSLTPKHIASPIRLSLTRLSLRTFWQWTKFSDYIAIVSAFASVMGGLMWLLSDQSWFVESVGFASLLLEAMLALPQWLRNRRARSTAGMSVVMVVSWLSGDIFKTVYFFIREAPAQFFLCGMLQISMDLAVLFQVLQYWDKSPKRTTKYLHV